MVNASLNQKVKGHEGVTKFDPDTRYSPYTPGGIIKGIVAPDWEDVMDPFLQNFEDGLEQGAQLCVMHGEDTVVNLYGVGAEGARTTPKDSYDLDTLQCVYSSGKNVEAIVIAILVDRGIVSYDDPIAKHWPEFAQNGKGDVTIADLMRHSAGLSVFVDPQDRSKYRQVTVDDVRDREPMHRLIESSPKATFGDSPMSYHALTRGLVVDGLLKRVDLPAGRTIGHFVREEVLLPLGIQDRYFVSLTEKDETDNSVAKMEGYPEKYSSCVDFGPALSGEGDPFIASFLKLMDPSSEIIKAQFGKKWSHPIENEPAGRSLEVTSSYNFACAHSLSRLLSVFANGGRVGNVQLLSESTVKTALGDTLIHDDHLFGFEGGFTKGGLGQMETVRTFDCQPYFNDMEGFYGWCGLGGSINVIHPEKRITVSYLMNVKNNRFVGGLRTDRIFSVLKAIMKRI